MKDVLLTTESGSDPSEEVIREILEEDREKA